MKRPTQGLMDTVHTHHIWAKPSAQSRSESNGQKALMIESCRSPERHPRRRQRVSRPPWVAAPAREIARNSSARDGSRSGEL